MKWYLNLLCCCILPLGCSSTQVQETSPATEHSQQKFSQDSKDQPMVVSPKSPVKENREVPPGTPVANANYQMQKSQKDMEKTLKMIQQVQAGDITVDCQKDPAASFKVLSGFFNRAYFDYSATSFWFLTSDGRKIEINPEDGTLRQCKFGVFSTAKRLITYQFKDETSIQTEFYIDERDASLAVHHYQDGRLTGNENYSITK